MPITPSYNSQFVADRPPPTVSPNKVDLVPAPHHGPHLMTFEELLLRGELQVEKSRRKQLEMHVRNFVYNAPIPQAEDNSSPTATLTSSELAPPQPCSPSATSTKESEGFPGRLSDLLDEFRLSNGGPYPPCATTCDRYAELLRDVSRVRKQKDFVVATADNIRGHAAQLSKEVNALAVKAVKLYVMAKEDMTHLPKNVP